MLSEAQSLMTLNDIIKDPIENLVKQIVDAGKDGKWDAIEIMLIITQGTTLMTNLYSQFKSMETEDLIQLGSTFEKARLTIGPGMT